MQINEDDHILPSNQPLVDEFEHYIIKFAGISISQTKLLQGKENSYFAIKRFNRNGDERVHIHSLSGLVHSNFRLPSVDYDDILKLTLHFAKDINEVLKVYRLAEFTLLTHNRDDHAKNFLKS